MNSSIISLLILISTLLLPSFCDDNPFDCSTDDLQLTVTCRPALAKLTEEMRKNPLSGVMPSSDTLHKMSAHCRDASNCMKSARCSAIRNKMQKFSKTCNTIEFMAGPYAQCASKLKTKPNNSDCISWYFSDKSKPSNSRGVPNAFGAPHCPNPFSVFNSRFPNIPGECKEFGMQKKLKRIWKTANSHGICNGCQKQLSTEQKCAQFKAKKSCIEQDFGKFCGAATMKDFRDNLDYVSKFVGCPVH